MKASKDAPEWAIKMIEEICKSYNRTLPGELKWVVSKTQDWSNGHCHYAKSHSGKQKYIMRTLKNGKMKWSPDRGHLYVRAGSSLEDQKHVVMHEAAHWCAYRGKGHGHTVKFWRVAFEVYHKWGDNLLYSCKREQRYKKQSISVFKKLYEKNIIDFTPKTDDEKLTLSKLLQA